MVLPPAEWLRGYADDQERSLPRCLSTLLLTTVGLPGWAASFDCAKAETADEKAVCADRQLNDEDVEMSVLYSQLRPLLGMGARGDLDDEQVA
jgi:uncharacterized protein